MSMHMELDDEQDAIDDEYDFFIFFIFFMNMMNMLDWYHDTICLLPLEYDDMLIALSVYYLDDDWRYVLV